MAERTKLWIADKMKDLMKKKPLDKIRITEICTAAEIERSTFYYHFKDKYELVAWIFFQAADRTNIIDLHDSAEAMKQMKNDMLFYRRAYEDNSQNALWRYMLEYFVEKYTRLARELSGSDIQDAQTLFSIRMYCYGAVGMTREWVLQDNLTSAETIVRMMFSSMPEILKQVFFRNPAL
ncbi:MAG TPA: TetR family transcriptional regulator [Lachnospiraceae bacterium]|nr:TetR family transcriptional regulator [Lachnospiraceae bacterium]